MKLKATTAEEHVAAMDVLVRAALTNERGPLTTGLSDMLGTLQRPAGIRVANILVMLAGKAVPSDEDWRKVLLEHLRGSGGAI